MIGALNVPKLLATGDDVQAAAAGIEEHPVLLATIAVALTAAFLGGLVARKLRLPPIVGYLAAGVAIGPFTPGLSADTEIASEFAEFGVILLMFGVGIHFSIRDLLAVRRIAVPGAIAQIAVATLLGAALGLALGWGVGGALVLGLALSVASTVVLLRALMDRDELTSSQGRIAVGWLIVEDLFTVVILVALPALAPVLGADGAGGSDGSLGAAIGLLGLAAAKAGLFAVVMVVIGVRLLPRLLVEVARDGSRELFTLAVLAIALGLAFMASAVFGVSLALGAFVAGAIVGESDLSHQAAADALPLRDAFAVLFFVSIGMLVDPVYLLGHPVEVVAVVGLIMLAKSLAAFAIVLVLGYPSRTALTVAAALAQIGEFSFILATLGVSLGLLLAAGFQLVVAGALISITLNPLLFRLVEPLDARLRTSAALGRLRMRGNARLRQMPEPPDFGSGHDGLPAGRLAIICGYGRVGRMIADALGRRGFGYVVISDDRREVERLRRDGIPAVYGDASHREVLADAGAARALLVIAAVNDPHATRLIVERARELNPRINVVARTHSYREADRLSQIAPMVEAVYAERELAVQMLRSALRRYGLSMSEAELVAQGIRRRAEPAPPVHGRRSWKLPRLLSPASARQRIGRWVNRARSRAVVESVPTTRQRSSHDEAAEPPPVSPVTQRGTAVVDPS